MSQDDDTPARLRWARLRFSIIGSLLHSPPEKGELATRIDELAKCTWRHPTTGDALTMSAKTIERMYYAVRYEKDPIAALARKVPKHAGLRPSVSPELGKAVEKQYGEHPRWSYQLHYDNLVVLAREDSSLGQMPSYVTIRRFMKDRGMYRSKKRVRGKGSPEEEVARETRSYEQPYVNALWHFDFHEGKRQVLLPSGEYRTPYLFALRDDCSRLICHAQWYLDRENTQDLVHGLCQGFQKRKLPRAVISDRGAPMKAAETVEGLERLSITQELTLPRSPQQNAKIEVFWAQVEGRFMAMLEGEPVLTLDLLNRATQAWVEQEYHHTVHSELKKTPLQRYLEGPDLGRPCPDSETLRRAFRTEVKRTQRRSDGTVTVEGVRYEVPSAYRTLTLLSLRVARWDLSSVEMVDPRTGAHLCTLLPLDKARNADGRRRVLAPIAASPTPAGKPAGIAPLLRSLMADYAATGLPPGYLPKNEPNPSQEDD